MLSQLFPRRSHFAVLLLVCVSLSQSLVAAQEPKTTLELSRAVRPWEFLGTVGTRAALFGKENGPFEAWVYPLKILRHFQLRFLIDGHVVPAEALARTVIVRPESNTIVYSGDTFSVRETLFVPVHEPAAVISLEVETTQPLEVEAQFERDFQLEWPAAVGGTTEDWDADLRAFSFGEEQRKYEALVGSPSATDVHEEFSDNYSASRRDSFRLGVTTKGKETRIIVIAASLKDRAEAVATYRRVSNSYRDLMQDSSRYYENYLQQTVGLNLPDNTLQQAYDWARISMIQGLVQNPFLGTGLIAGYNEAGDGERPGFGWFFGRDALWTALALDAAGDFETTRAALDFLSRYQRADGKVPHEISQSASLVPWFDKFPYAYAAADATPLFVIATSDYVAQSGDVAFAQEKWDNLWRAYQFLRSTYDAQGLPQNFGVGHGWVEGGPLLPVNTELYQSALGAEALKAMSRLAHRLGKEDVSKDLNQAFERQRNLLNQVFWSPEKGIYAFALDRNDARVDMPSVLATVPMWFGLLDAEKSDSMINHLAEPEHQTDWGMRIISSQDPKYDPGGYHFGVVWPLFTGWASVGEYQYHRALPAYSNLMTNALLTFDGALGHVTEVLSGNYHAELSTSTPDQTWSSAMVVSPLLRGLFGLQSDASTRHLVFAPHVPADWTWFTITHVKVGPVVLNLDYHKTGDSITLQVQRRGSGDCVLEFSPALSLRGEVLEARLNGRPVAFHIQANSIDQHVTVEFPISGESNTLLIRVRNDFGLSQSVTLPALSGSSRGLRILSQAWSPAHDSLRLEVAGAAGTDYELAAWNAGQLGSVDGAAIEKRDSSAATIRVQIPASAAETYPHAKIVLHFLTGSYHVGAKFPKR
ncbi:MAG: amylo-alpha-1,6-glucosidase [Terriglobales bacterium]